MLVVAPGEFEKSLAGADPRHDVAVRDGSDTAVILYTSGTTGNPKGAELATTTWAATSAPTWPR